MYIRIGEEPDQVWTLDLGDLLYGRTVPLAVQYQWEAENYNDEVRMDLTRKHLQQLRDHIDRLLTHPHRKVPTP